MAEVDGGCEGVDLLSGLPVDVRSHVLSFLTLEDAIKKKLLSRTWKQLHPPNPTLQFNTRSYEKCYARERQFNVFFNDEKHRYATEKLVATVNKAIEQFGAPKLEALELDLGLYESELRRHEHTIDGWIRFGGMMKVEKIRLYIYNSGGTCMLPYMFPLQLLHVSELCRLKHLELQNCRFPPSTSSHAPIISVRTLVLRMFDFFLDDGTFESIPSYFPKLEHLTFAYCALPSFIRGFFCRLYHLKSLAIRNCAEPEDFEIHDANLTSIKYIGWHTESISFKGLNCLQSLDISVAVPSMNIAFFSEGSPLLKSFTIHCSPWWEEFEFPSSSTFECLNRLDLRDYTATHSNLQNLLRVLQVAPVLQKLSINLSEDSVEWSAEWLEEHLYTEQDQRGCEMHASSHLKEIEIALWGSCNFGREAVNHMIVLLESATFLEKMVLDSYAQDAELPRALARYKPEVKFLVTFRKPKPYLF